MRKQLLVLLAGISLVSGTAFAGELTSFTHEAVFNNFDLGYEQLEWTLGKGAYKINDKLTFNFDIDKDYITSSKVKFEGWDTEFGLVQNAGKVGSWDLSLNYVLRYDDQWKAENYEKVEGIDRTVQYIFSPYFSKDITLLGKTFSFGTELWAQVGKNKGETFKALSGAEVNFYLDGALSKNNTISLAMYNTDYYNADSKKYDYQIATENKLTYSLPLKENLAFTVENYIYAYYTPNTEESKIDAYVKPKVKYTKQVDDHLSIYGAVSYEVFNYTEKGHKVAATTKVWANNEMETTIGFKIK